MQKCPPPENPMYIPHPDERPGYRISYFQELEFPRKLENCTVRLWYGSEFRGSYSTDEYQMWLLSDNVIKLDNGKHLWVVYNAVIVVDYHNYPEKD